MATENLEELLTGKALGISRERLDVQGWVAAFRSYKDASPNERLAMEVSLAQAISESGDWAFIADAIHLARSLRMANPSIRAAIIYAKLAAPQRYRDVISTEATRYIRDVPKPASEPRDVQHWETTGTSDVDLSKTRFYLNTNQSSLGEIRRRAQVAD